MPCYHPLVAVNKYTTSEGKMKLRFFNHSEPLWIDFDNDNVLHLPCGKCIGCRLDYSRMWADRMLLESLYHDYVYFITLTYDDDHLPSKGVMVDDDGVVVGDSPRHPLVKKHWQDFLKRYREHFRRERSDNRVRFYACGEYGSKSQRPHYHAILFQNFPLELKYWKRGGKTGVLYTCEVISQLWSDDEKNSIGISCVSPANWSTMAYVARYVTKKLDGALDNYDKLGFTPEFSLCSRKPGIARQYFDDNKDAFFTTDKIVVPTNEGAKEILPPRYFLRLLADEDPDFYNQIVSNRVAKYKNNIKQKQNLTALSYYDMLKSQKEVLTKRTKSLRRNDV